MEATDYTGWDNKGMLTANEIRAADLLAEESRKADSILFARLVLGEGVPEGVDLTALLDRIDRIAPTDGELAWACVREYWALCNQRTAQFRALCEQVGGKELVWMLPRLRNAYLSLVLLAFRAVTGWRIVPLRRMQTVLSYLYS